jgi:3-phosphoshikimate 1-carboxyvinyltransferase
MRNICDVSDAIAIQPIPPFSVSLRPPGSKSLTNRALLLAALATGDSRLTGVLFSDDTRRMLDALQTLGFALDVNEKDRTVRVTGRGGAIPADRAKLDLGNAGTAFRFLTAACCLGQGVYDLDGIARMRQRPIAELVDALRQIGGIIDYSGERGFPPLRIGATGLRGGHLTMPPTLSSQYISALLHVAPYCNQGLTIEFNGPVTSRPYVEMTVQLMRCFGVQPQVADDFSSIRIAPGKYQPRDYAIEPDASNASYFFAAAAIIAGSRCTIEGLGRESLQGDVRFAHVLAMMGATVSMSSHSVTVSSPQAGALRGIDIDLNDMPDMAQTLAAVALFAIGPTTIRNIGNLRVKETDRIAALQTELAKLGATVAVYGDDMTITPPPAGEIRPAAIDTYDDHRMAMSFAVVGLRAAGVVINDPTCVDKTYPDFFDDLNQLRGPVRTSP